MQAFLLITHTAQIFVLWHSHMTTRCCFRAPKVRGQPILDDPTQAFSSDIYKIWNTRTQTPIRTLEGVSPKACIFLPGDEYVLVLALNGTLNLYSVASAALISSIPAHTKGASLCLRPNGLGIMSGGDLDVKFWDFYMDEDKLKLEHMRTLKMSDDVTCVRYSPDGKLVCVAMIDCCVKVFFNDTLAFYLNLYGHRVGSCILYKTSLS